MGAGKVGRWSMSNDPKKLPHGKCGRKAKLEGIQTGFKNQVDWYRIWCGFCKENFGEAGQYESEREIIKAWNEEQSALTPPPFGRKQGEGRRGRCCKLRN